MCFATKILASIAAMDRAYYLAHRERWKEYREKFLLAHPEYDKAYLLAHPEQRKKTAKKYRLSHCEQIKIYHKARYKAHKERWKEYAFSHCEQIKKNKEKHYVTHREKIIARTNKSRRQLGFIPLNDYFKGAVRHHVDRERVIYIPEELHKSIWHSVLKNRNMEQIKEVAYRFLTGE